MSHHEDFRRIVIIGAGPGGRCMTIKLREAGIRDFVILEEASGLGGTWYHNRYPGLCCDIPSYLYSFSFEPKRDWSRPYPPQPEILAYLEDVAAKYEIVPHNLESGTLGRVGRVAREAEQHARGDSMNFADDREHL
jgi:cation diffusion facilitator CzcD-associated flavoprotein CzcO